LSELTLFAEILGSNPLPGSLELVSALLETLSKLLQIPPTSQADVNYAEQMLMSAIDNAASNISVCSTSRALWCQPLKYLKESSNMVPSVLRLDVLIEVIRGEFAIINIVSCCAHVIKLSGTLRLFTKPCCLWRAWLVWHQNLCYTMLCPFSPSWGPMSSIVMTPIVSG